MLEVLRFHVVRLVQFTVIGATCGTVVPIAALGQCEIAKLLASDGVEDDFFGWQAAICGDVAVIAARGDDDNGAASGSAYVFRRDSATWVEEAKLLASDGAAHDRFGDALGIAENIIVIGASGDDDNGASSGSAYVFRSVGSHWVEEAKLLASDGARYDSFASSVGVFDDTVVVGAWADDDQGPGSGSAYIFRHDGSDWVQEAKLVASDGAPNNCFGMTVAAWANTVVIGAVGIEGYPGAFAKAYVFRFVDSAWIEEAILLAFDEKVEEARTAVAVWGDVVLVGAGHTGDSGPYSGSAYVFRFDGSSWAREAKLLPSDGAEWDLFGHSVTLSADSAVIGAPNDGNSGGGYGDGHGSAYVFRFDGATWTEQAKLLASDGAASDFFGVSVALCGNTALMGSPYDDDQSPECGSAYVFDLDPIPGDLNCDGCVDQADLGILLADWGCTGGNCPGDCDGDGDTDQADLGVVLTHWGEGCP
jgi:hypothetical protein